MIGRRLLAVDKGRLNPTKSLYVNLPEEVRKMDTLIISPESGLEKFENFNIVYTRTNPHILSYESFHGDMQLCVCGDGIIVPPYFYDYYKKNLKGKKIICGSSDPFGPYPQSAAYNVAVTDNFAICNLAAADSVILDWVKQCGKELINVKQGYSKCSLCIAGDGVITADRGIYKAVYDKMPALLITAGFVKLPGCEYGFLGGASGFVDGRLIFAGDITTHPDFLKIEKFLEELNIPYTCLAGELTDYGSLIFV